MWHIEVDHNVDFLNVDTSSKQVSGDQNSEFDLFELVVDGVSLFLWKLRIACFSWETFLFDDLAQLLGILLLTGKNDHLVELKAIEKINQFHDLFLFFQFNVILL